MEPGELLGKVVVDVAKKAAGRVVKVHEPGAFISKVNGKPVQGVVIEFETGDSFVWKEPSPWVVLDAAKGEALYLKAQQVAVMFSIMLGKEAKMLGVDEQTALLVVGRALQLQGGKLLGTDDVGEGWR
jgi:hypothetical protein